MLSIRLPAEMEKRLEKLAKRTERTKSFYVRQALELTFDILEEYPTETDRREQRADLVRLLLAQAHAHLKEEKDVRTHSTP